MILFYNYYSIKEVFKIKYPGFLMSISRISPNSQKEEPVENKDDDSRATEIEIKFYLSRKRVLVSFALNSDNSPS